MSIDQVIEELRAESRNAVHPGERREIEAELARAIAERDLLLAEAYGPFFGEPPF